MPFFRQTSRCGHQLSRILRIKEKTMKLLAIIPAYNEEKSIVAVVEAFTAAYPQYDYLIVNDGGHDRTLDICREHGYHIVSLP
ncbi:MAG: glycosyltransferase, partial [Ruthenibacterium sp.]